MDRVIASRNGRCVAFLLWLQSVTLKVVLSTDPISGYSNGEICVVEFGLHTG